MERKEIALIIKEAVRRGYSHAKERDTVDLVLCLITNEVVATLDDLQLLPEA